MLNRVYVCNTQHYIWYDTTTIMTRRDVLTSEKKILTKTTTKEFVPLRSVLLWVSI